MGSILYVLTDSRWLSRCTCSSHREGNKRWLVQRRRREQRASGGLRRSPRPAPRTTMQILKQTRPVAQASSSALEATTVTTWAARSSRYSHHSSSSSSNKTVQMQRHTAASCGQRCLTSSRRQVKSTRFKPIGRASVALSARVTTITTRLPSICQPAPYSTKISTGLDSMPAMAYSNTFDQRKYNY